MRSDKGALVAEILLVMGFIGATVLITIGSGYVAQRKVVQPKVGGLTLQEVMNQDCPKTTSQTPTGGALPDPCSFKPTPAPTATPVPTETPETVVIEETPAPTEYVPPPTTATEPPSVGYCPPGCECYNTGGGWTVVCGGGGGGISPATPEPTQMPPAPTETHCATC